MKSCSLLIILLVTWAFAESPQQPSSPYKHLLDTPTSFSGIKKETFSEGDEIIISFLLPADEFVAKTIRQAAGIAIDQANRYGGYNGSMFKAVYRAADSPWKAGSGETIKLVYEDSADVLLTSFSADSHIAAQIAAKSLLPVISLFSGDETLNQARLPWIFRLAPGYTSQIERLTQHGLANKMRKVGLISTIDQDSRLAGKTAENIMSKRGLAPQFHYQLGEEPGKNQITYKMIMNEDLDAVFLCTTANKFRSIAETLTALDVRCPLYLTWTPGLDMSAAASWYKGEIVAAAPPIINSCNLLWDKASIIYALALDGTNFAIEAIRYHGPESQILQNSFAAIKEYSTVNGTYRFDNGGGNITPPDLCKYNH